MNLTTALKIMSMSAKALTKKYGSRAVGLSKRIKAGDVIKRAKEGRRLTPGGKYLTPKKANRAENFRMKNKGRKLTKKEIEDMEYDEAMREGPSGMFRKRG